MIQKEKVPTLLKSFNRDGFIALPKFLSENVLAELVKNLERFVHEIVPRLEDQQVFYEDRQVPSSLKQIQHMDAHDSWFHHFFHKGPFRELAAVLLQGPVVPKNMQFFNKPPGIGQATPPHQDGFYFMLTPCEAVTMWLALEKVDEENGCVRYVKGSHKQGMRTHTRTQTLGFSQGISDYPSHTDLENEITFPAAAGDLLIHDALTIHRADGNHSSRRTRKALGFIYYSERAEEDIQVRNAYQRQLTEEMRVAGKI